MIKIITAVAVMSLSACGGVGGQGVTTAIEICKDRGGILYLQGRIQFDFVEGKCQDGLNFIQEAQ